MKTSWVTSSAASRSRRKLYANPKTLRRKAGSSRAIASSRRSARTSSMSPASVNTGSHCPILATNFSRPSELRRLIATGRRRCATRDRRPVTFHEIEDEIGGADGDCDPAGTGHRIPQPVLPAKYEGEADTEPDQAAQQIA